jgi:hypothetical protein
MVETVTGALVPYPPEQAKVYFVESPNPKAAVDETVLEVTDVVPIWPMSVHAFTVPVVAVTLTAEPNVR